MKNTFLSNINNFITQYVSFMIQTRMFLCFSHTRTCDIHQYQFIEDVRKVIRDVFVLIKTIYESSF